MGWGGGLRIGVEALDRAACFWSYIGWLYGETIVGLCPHMGLFSCRGRLCVLFWPHTFIPCVHPDASTTPRLTFSCFSLTSNLHFCACETAILGQRSGFIGWSREVKRKIPVSFTPNPMNYNHLLYSCEGWSWKMKNSWRARMRVRVRTAKRSSLPLSKWCDDRTWSETRFACRIVEIENANSLSWCWSRSEVSGLLKASHLPLRRRQFKFELSLHAEIVLFFCRIVNLYCYICIRIAVGFMFAGVVLIGCTFCT